MGEAFKHQLLSMLKRQKNRRHRALKVLSLCLLVAIVTATALRMPGEAMTHTSRVLACSLQGSAEPVVHTHNTDCYDENGALVCPLPERASHTHTEACYDENGALICGQEEITTEHIHNEACFYTVELTDEEVATINDTEAAAAPEPAGAPASETPANVMADMPVQEIEESIPGGALRVHVSAPAGALPAGTAIQILNIYPDGLPDDHVVRTEHGVILTGRGADVLFIANGEIVHPAIPVAAKLIIDNITVNAGMVYVEDADADHDVTEEDACYRIVILPSEEALLPRTDAATEEAPVPAEPDQTVTAAETDTAAETVDVNEAMPEQIFDADTDEGVHVHVVAPEGAFPAGTVMNVTDIDDADVLDTIANAVEGTVRSMQAVDITFTYEDDAIEPLVPVAVSLTSAAVSENASVVHVDHEGEATVVEDVNVTEDSAVFDADAFSVYAVVDITLEDTIITSDGQNYHITATYGPETGIPADAVLDVREVTEGDTAYDIGYEDYVANTEAALGMEAGSAAYIRLFDIKIVDAEDPEIQYQPAEGTTVDVRIELADAEPAEDETLNVVHFADGAAEGDVVEVTESENQAVRFAAGAFSVYGVVSSGATTNLDGKTFALITLNDGCG